MSKFRSFRLVIFLILSTLAFVETAHAKTVTIALVSDGDGQQEVIQPELLKKEIQLLLEPEFKPVFIQKKGNWSRSGVDKALKESLSDNKINIIVTQGLIGSHLAGVTETLSKPVIAISVPSPKLQGIPISDNNTSGKKNYTYNSTLLTFEQGLAKILSIIPRKKMGLVADSLILQGLPMLADPAFLGNENIQIIESEETVEKTIAKLPDNLDSLLIAPLPKWDNKQILEFTDHLKKADIVSVAFAGSVDISNGVLMTFGMQPSESQKIARRISLNILSALKGENLANLPVQIEWGQSIVFNTDTAASVGFELPWEESLVIEQYTPTKFKRDDKNTLSLNSVVKTALDKNLRLSAQRLNIDISNSDIKSARSLWFPNLSFGAQVQRVDDIIASPQNPEQSSDISLQLSQLIYSEEAKSNLDIAKLSREAEEQQVNLITLETIRDVSIAYLSVLRAKALEQVQRANLQASIQNLTLSENRFELGAVVETDVLRWKSQISLDKQNLLNAQTSIKNAIINLQNLLDQPVTEFTFFDEKDTEKLLDNVLRKEVVTVFNNPRQVKYMKDWITLRAMKNSPQIQLGELAHKISQRQTRAGKRAYFIPNISLIAEQTRNLNRSGSFAEQANASLPEESWFVGINATFPIVTGGSKQSTLRKAKLQEQQSLIERKIIENAINANALSSWNTISASYPAIFLSREANDAAKRNLELIRNQYARGTINITTLIDAQNSALNAEISTAEAKYTYLIDFINLGFAMSDFRSLTQPKQLDYWLSEFYEFASEQDKKTTISDSDNSESNIQ